VETKVIRLLNVKCAPPRSVKPCKPETVLFSWPDDVHVAFDPNSLCAVQVDAAAAHKLEKGPDGFTGLLFSGVAPEFPPPAGGPERAERVERVRKLVLNLTHACNLRCKYCFAADYDGVPGGAHGAPAMPPETAFKALSLFDDGVNRQARCAGAPVAKDAKSEISNQKSEFRNRAPLSVSFFGGEPLLAWPTLILTAERIYQLAYERKVSYSLHVTTNGTLITPLKAAALKRFNFSVLLSLDGPKEIHNASRPTAADAAVNSQITGAPCAPRNRQSPIANHPSSFDLAMSGLDALNAAGIIPSIRATFSELPAQLVERLEFFDALYRLGKISGVSIEPAILAEGCASVPQTEMDLARLEEEWHAAAEWFVERARAGKPFPFFYFRKILARLLNCEFHGSECGAGRGYLTVGPDGKIFACHRESGTAIGHLPDPSDQSNPSFDSSARQPWLRNCINEHPECAECWARYLCGGGCAQNRVEIGGAVTAPVPNVCAARRVMMKQVLWIAAQLTQEEALKAAGLGADERGREK